MPVKRRIAKRRRMTEEQELAALADVFASGFDYFDDLGLGGGFGSTEAYREAARKAWPRLGGHFLEDWTARGKYGSPWALDAFGQPKGAH